MKCGICGNDKRGLLTINNVILCEVCYSDFYLRDTDYLYFGDN